MQTTKPFFPNLIKGYQNIEKLATTDYSLILTAKSIQTGSNVVIKTLLDPKLGKLKKKVK